MTGLHITIHSVCVGACIVKPSLRSAGKSRLHSGEEWLGGAFGTLVLLRHSYLLALLLAP